MGIYKEEYFFKNQKGEWVKSKNQIVRAPHDVGRWQRSVELEKKNGGYYSLVQAEVTKSGFNKKVSFVSTMIGKDERVDRTLITTSNKLSKRDREKYKGIKGCDSPIKR